MKTIQISTTNLIYFMEKHPEYKRKLLDEIIPAVKPVADRIVKGLDYDRVMEFEYLPRCFYESIRIQPPATRTQHN